MVKNRLKYGYACFWFLAVLTLTGCQNTKDKLFADEDELILPDTELFEMALNITLKDGSHDNIIDNSSCLSVLYPIAVKANKEFVLLNSEEDLDLVRAIHNKERYDVDEMEINFPIQAVTAEYKIVDIGSEEDLSEFTRFCIEGGDDPDIECVDFVYPLDVRTYSGTNQKLKIQSVVSDSEFFVLFNQIDNSGWISFLFPFGITHNGSQLNVGSNSEFLNIFDDAAEECDEGDKKYYDESILPVPTGKLRVSVTDAPFPIALLDSANVFGSSIEIRKIDEDTSFFITLTEDEFSFDLLTLTNGSTFEIVEIDIPLGTYNEVRIFISDAKLTLIDGRVFDLKIPGSESSGLKVKIHPSISILENEESELLLDFDLSKSFVVQGNPDKPEGIIGFLFKPVVKATNLVTTGTLFGVITGQDEMLLSGAQVSLFIADTLNTTTFSGIEGQYRFLGLQSGEYTVEVQAIGFQTATFDGIMIEVADNQELNVVLQND